MEQHLNFIAVIISAFVPLIVGFIWYNDSVMGKAWMKSANLTKEQLNKGKMAPIFIASIILSFLLATSVPSLVIHQLGLVSLVGGELEGADSNVLQVLETHRTVFRSFAHGMLHGGLMTVFLILPILGINALFERRGWKYIFINSGYWFICLMIMGGLVCGWYELGSFNWLSPK